jgi:hypothetical protein
MATFFNEYFRVTKDKVDDYGAFNVSIINDLPLFIDPFLLFNSPKANYQQLHTDILKYMMFLRDKIIAGGVNNGRRPRVRCHWELAAHGGVRACRCELPPECRTDT